MFNYHPVPSGPVLNGTINEEEAVREKGLKVRVGAVMRQKNSRRTTGARSFSVETLDSQPLFSNLKLCIFIILVLTIIFAIAGGMFMKFAVPPIISRFLHYPSANCTMLSYTAVATKGGEIYNMQVEYTDANNVNHTKEMSVGENIFESRNFTIGVPFDCVYKGSFVMDKQTIQEELDSVDSIWYYGFVVGGFSNLFFSVLIFFVMRRMLMSGNINYYRRIFSYQEDESVVINDWGPVPSNVQKYLWVLMHTVCSMEPVVSREISFRPSLKSASKGAFVFLVIFCLCFVGGFFVAAYFLGYGINAQNYLFSEFFIFESFPMLVLGGYIFKMCTYTRYAVDTRDYTIIYSVKPDGISGTLTPLNPALLSNA